MTWPYELGWWGGGRGLAHMWTDEERSIVSSWHFTRNMNDALGSRCEVYFAAKTGVTERAGFSVEYPLGPRKKWRAYIRAGDATLTTEGETVSITETLGFLNLALEESSTFAAIFREFSKLRIDVEHEGEPFATVLGQRFAPAKRDIPPGRYTYRDPRSGKWRGLNITRDSWSSFPLGELEPEKLDEAEKVFDDVS